MEAEIKKRLQPFLKQAFRGPLDEGVLNRYLNVAMGDQDNVDTNVFKEQVEMLAATALEVITD